MRRFWLTALSISVAVFLTGCALVAPPDAESLDRGVILGSIWLDRDANGLRNEGENGIPEVRVQLLAGDGEFLIEKGADKEGLFRFELLDLEDTFYIQIVLPNEFQFTEYGGDSDVFTEGPIAGRTDLINFNEDGTIPVDIGLVLRE